MKRYIRRVLILIAVLICSFQCYAEVVHLTDEQWNKIADERKDDSKYVNLEGSDDCSKEYDETENMKIIFQGIKAWGPEVTDEFAAALCGNIYAESSYNPKALQNSKSVKEYNDSLNIKKDHKGRDEEGVGLCQWTNPGRTSGLLYCCHMLGVPWNDMGAQLEYARYEITTGFPSIWESRTGTDRDAICDNILLKFEAPKVPNYDYRRDNAEKCYNTCKGIGAKNVDGSSPSFSSSSGSSDSLIFGKYSEDSLEGMPEKSKLLDLQGDLKSAKYEDLALNERVSIAGMRENISLSESVSVMDMCRRIVAFIGLWLVSYSMVMFVAMQMDLMNNFFDFSMVGMLSLGKIQYNPNSVSQSGYVSTKRLRISLAILTMVGIIMLSGVLFRQFSKMVLWVTLKLV